MPGMKNSTSSLYLERVDRQKNMARFYRLSLEIDLFGHVIVVRSWGRIGTFGRQINQSHGGTKEAEIEFRRMAASKLKRGYRQVL